MLRPGKLDRNSIPRNLEDGVMVIVTDEAGNSNIHDDRVSLPIQQNETLPAPNEHTPSPAPEVILLSTEQQEVLDIVRAGDNVFFTGPAGIFKLFPSAILDNCLFIIFYFSLCVKVQVNLSCSVRLSS